MVILQIHFAPKIAFTFQTPSYHSYKANTLFSLLKVVLKIMQLVAAVERHGLLNHGLLKMISAQLDALGVI